MQFGQQRQLLVFICVSVRCTKISLSHWVTNVSVDVIILQYCKQTVQKQRGKMAHSCFFCQHVFTHAHVNTPVTDLLKSTHWLGFGRDLSTAVSFSQHIRLSPQPSQRTPAKRVETWGIYLWPA